MASHRGKIHIEGTMSPSTRPTPLSRLRALTTGALLVVSMALVGAQPLAGQDTYRVGITFGGTSFVSLNLEMLWGDAALDLSMGTWSFRDISVSAVGKYYAGSDSFKAFGGAGLWLITAFPKEEGERTGFATVLRLPLGLEGRIDGDHALGLEVNLDRALSVRRPDPTDDLPPNKRFVSLPGVYYRFALKDDSN